MLLDPAQQDQLERDGYVAIPFLRPDEVDAIKALHRQLGPAPGDPRTGLFNDTWAHERPYKAAMSAALHEIMAGPTAASFAAVRVIGWSNIMKWPGAGGAVVAHRDPTFVEEPQQRSIGVWCALDHLDERSGCLAVVPRSHLGAPAIRPHQDPANLNPEVDVVRDAQPVVLEPGEALVYDHALIHGSGPNHGPEVRIVVAGLLIPEGERCLYTLHTDELVVVEIDPSFLIDNQVDQLAVDQVLATRPVVRRIPLGATS